jgi:hypothetical protein
MLTRTHIRTQTYLRQLSKAIAWIQVGGCEALVTEQRLMIQLHLGHCEDSRL